MEDLKKFEEFANWLRDSHFNTVIIIAGNHDTRFQKEPEKARKILSKHDKIHYLEDSGCRIEGISFYGSPWQPEFSHGWAFTLAAEGELRNKWRSIPSNTHVLITHGPPAGILDFIIDGRHVGSTSILAEINQRVKPQLHLFGHIHEGYGVRKIEETKFVNASICSHDYVPIHPPLVVEIS